MSEHDLHGLFKHAFPAFAPIRKVAELTGLSMWWIRKGCTDGTIPCIRTGRTIYVNLREFMQQLDQESHGGGGEANGPATDVQ